MVEEYVVGQTVNQFSAQNLQTARLLHRAIDRVCRLLRITATNATEHSADKQIGLTGVGATYDAAERGAEGLIQFDSDISQK